MDDLRRRGHAGLAERDGRRPAHRVVPWSGEPLAGEGEEKVMLLVQAESLPAAVAEVPPRQRRHRAAVCLVAWFPADADSPDRYRAESRGAADLCFAADDATAARLAMLTPRVFQAAPGPKLLALATTWANGQTFYEATRPAAERARSLPRVFRPEKRAARVLLQADDFTQGGTEQVVLDLARSLRSDDFDVSLLILGKQGSDAVQDAAGRNTRALPARATTARATTAAC